jgi:hypothetical protein
MQGNIFEASLLVKAQRSTPHLAFKVCQHLLTIARTVCLVLFTPSPCFTSHEVVHYSDF